jgi:hypothetical protein
MFAGSGLTAAKMLTSDNALCSTFFADGEPMSLPMWVNVIKADDKPIPIVVAGQVKKSWQWLFSFVRYGMKRQCPPNRSSRSGGQMLGYGLAGRLSQFHNRVNATLTEV